MEYWNEKLSECHYCGKAEGSAELHGPDCPNAPRYAPSYFVKLQPCNHLWVRRRDGSWCAYCGEPRFGVELNEEERNKIQERRTHD